METPLEIRYAGVVIGRAQEVLGVEGDGASFFLPVRDPMPVGTVLHLRAGERESAARVVHAVETADPATSGMRVRPIGECGELAPEFIPPRAAAPEKLKVSAPVAEPSAPLAEPSAPVAEPSAPVTEPSAPIVEPVSAAPVEDSRQEDIPAATATTAADNGTVAESVAESGNATDQPAGADSEQPTGADLPPARPITRPNGRRKTKRRG